MDIRVPHNVSSITLATAGVKVPTANVITGVGAVEGTLLVQRHVQPRIVTTNAVTGAATIQVPSVVTSITINGNVYAVSGGQITGVPAADINDFLKYFHLGSFTLVQG